MRKHRTFYLSLIVFVVWCNALVYLQYSVSDAHAPLRNPVPDSIRLQNGDVVLRNGRGLISSVFRQSSLQQKKFTHAGFLRKINNQWVVYHFIDDKIKSGLRIDPLQHFVNANSCNSYAFCRYQLNNEEKQQLDNIILESQKKQLPFDADFNLHSDSAMYCTEWIAKSLDCATQQKDFVPQTTIEGLAYIAPDNLYLNNHCKLIYQNKY